MNGDEQEERVPKCSKYRPENRLLLGEAAEVVSWKVVTVFESILISGHIVHLPRTDRRESDYAWQYRDSEISRSQAVLHQETLVWIPQNGGRFVVLLEIETPVEMVSKDQEARRGR